MARRRRSSRGRVSAVDREAVGPTPETLAKLKPDPFNEMGEKGWTSGNKTHRLDNAQLDAGLEIRAIYAAITGPLMPRGNCLIATRGAREMSDALSSAHAQTYVPWCHDWGRLVSLVIDLVWDAQPAASPDLAAKMLRDYARCMRLRPRGGVLICPQSYRTPRSSRL